MPTPRCFDAKPKESWGLKPFCPAWPTYALPAEPSSLLSDAVRPCVWGPEGAAVNGGAGGGAAVCTCAPPDEHYRMCRVGRACLQHRWMCAS